MFTGEDHNGKSLLSNLISFDRLLELGKMVFEKDGSSPVCNEILYGRAGYLYSLLLVRNVVSDVKEDSFIKEVRILFRVNCLGFGSFG